MMKDETPRYKPTQGVPPAHIVLSIVIEKRIILLSCGERLLGNLALARVCTQYL